MYYRVYGYKSSDLESQDLLCGLPQKTCVTTRVTTYNKLVYISCNKMKQQLTANSY